MELKRFSEYSKEEQVSLLRHWWYYYGKLLVTLKDIEDFDKLVQEDTEFVKDAAVVAYINGQSSQALVGAMRANRLDELKEIINNIVSSEEYKKISDAVDADFMRMVIGSYVNPEPNVPMTDEQIIQSIAAMSGTTSDHVKVIKVSMDESCNIKGPQKKKNKYERRK